MAGDLNEEQGGGDLGDAFERAAANAEAAAAEMRGDGVAGSGGESAAEATAAPAPSNAEVIGVGLSMVRAMPLFARRFPRAVACLTDEAIAENAAAVGGLMDKYGWSFGGLDAWAVELRAAVAVGSLAFAVSDALAADIQAERVKAARDVTPKPDQKPQEREAPPPEPPREPGASWASAQPA